MSLLSKLIDLFKKKPTPPGPKPIGDLLGAHNNERDNAGRPSLFVNSKLTAAAQKHADKMARTNNLAHSKLITVVSAEGYIWRRLGENIAFAPDEQSAMAMWMNSPGHRANILNKDYKDVGFGRSGNYWCVIFGSAT